MFRNLRSRAAGNGGELSAAATLAELASQHDRMESARRAVSECCDQARGRLVAAQHSGDPAMILAAHRELETALKALRLSSVACDRTRRAFLGAKDSVAHIGAQRSHGAEAVVEAGGSRPRV